MYVCVPACMQVFERNKKSDGILNIIQKQDKFIS